MIIVGAAIVAVVVIVATVFLLSPPKDFWKGTYEVGDFAEYNVVTRDGDNVSRYTVTAVSSTEVSINVTDGNSYRVETLSVDSSFAFGFWPDFKIYPGSVSSYTVTNEVLVTKWGSLNCQHIVDTKGPNYKLYDEEWVYHGVVIKSTLSSPGGYKNMMLVNTNMEEVISS